MSTQMSSDLSPSKRVLAEPAMRRALEEFVRKRVAASDVDDIVQTVLVEALAAPARPQDETELRKWLLGIARHKVVDHHRRNSRETAGEIPDVPVGPAPVEARSLMQWAEKQAGPSSDARSTLEWMAREGEGEKLESIAAEEQVPAARVRQRVSRMRRWMKERWLAELAAAAAIAVVALVLWRIFSKKDEPITQPVPEPRPTTSSLPDPVLERARALRELAFESCDRSAWQDCLDKLDEARAIDPAGDQDAKVGAARARAAEALKNLAPKTSTPTEEPQRKPPAPPPTSSPTTKAPPKPPVSPKKAAPDPFEKDVKSSPPVKSPPVKSKFGVGKK